MRRRMMMGRGAQAPLWTPAAITTALWLDAADTETLTISGTTVTAWADKKGNGLSASANSGAVTLQSSAIGGLQALSFNGASSLIVSSVNIPSAQITAIAIGAFGALNIFSNTLLTLGTTANGFFHFTARSNLPNFFRMNCATDQISNNQSMNYPSSAIAINTPYILIGARGGNGPSTLYINGSLQSNPSDVLFTGNLTGGSSLEVGSQGSNKMTGKIAEIIIYDGYMPIDEINRMSGYLAHKWGLTANLPSDHPYKSAAPRV